MLKYVATVPGEPEFERVKALTYGEDKEESESGISRDVGG